MTLDTLPVTKLKGVGDNLAEKLAKLYIFSIQDLIFHLPFRYLDRTQITNIGSIKLNTNVVIQGRIHSAKVVFGKKRSLEVLVEDASGMVSLRFYHFSGSQKNNLETGRLIRCYGEPRLGRSGIEFYHPEYEFPESETDLKMESTLTPIYHLTDGVTQLRMRKLTQLAIEFLTKHPPKELLPKSLNEKFHIDSLAKALQCLHYPPPETAIAQLLSGTHEYQRRLAFEELLAHFLVQQKSREKFQADSSPVIKPSSHSLAEFLAQLPFKPTSAQFRVFEEINLDLQKGKPMLRMVQGDVGSGKTLVAALSALNCVEANYQVAVVAPTEILAEQHFTTFSNWFEPLNISVAWLVGKLTAKRRRETLEDIVNLKAQIIIGTHALFQDDVVIPKLGLSIIDEQHRFGVEQRLSLRRKSNTGEMSHQLIMTATPIPRTLAMTAYADLDYSIIDELPPGRKPINTALINQTRRMEVIERVHIAGKEGKQIYWVCPLIEESETLSVTNAEETTETLREAIRDLEIGLVHGRLKANEKEHIMAKFKSGSIQILVATTVIEVGVDVPNANLMIIENPERLGLAQLHQLRGRIGRGTEQSHCILMYGSPLSHNAKERLNVLRESNDGFHIAEKDLALRGPGDLMGTRQTGEMQFRIADPIRDASLIPLVHEIGISMLDQQPREVNQLIERWFKFAEVYSQV